MTARPALEVIKQITDKYVRDLRQTCSKYHFASTCPGIVLNHSVDHIEQYLGNWSARPTIECYSCAQAGRFVELEEIDNVPYSNPYMMMSISSGRLVPGFSSVSVPMVSETQLILVPEVPEESLKVEKK